LLAFCRARDVVRRDVFLEEARVFLEKIAGNDEFSGLCSSRAVVATVWLVIILFRISLHIVRSLVVDTMTLIHQRHGL